jgi:integrase
MAQTAQSRNSRNIHYRNIRTVFNEAIDDNITTFYPFRRFKIKNEVTAKRDLTVEELRQLFFYNCEESAVKYRDYFKLMFFLMGINNIDLCHLKEMVKGRVEFHRTKTHHFFSMKVEPEALEIIEKYRGEHWLLDILDHWQSDEYFRKKMNKALQKIGPVTRSGLGGKKFYEPLFPKLTTYYARHSWATVASYLDIPIETISAGLGHEYGNRITAIYINYDNRKVDVANRKVIDWVLYGKIDGEEVVKPGTPEFFGLEPEEAYKLGLCEAPENVPEKKHRGRPKKVA